MSNKQTHKVLAVFKRIPINLFENSSSLERTEYYKQNVRLKRQRRRRSVFMLCDSHSSVVCYFRYSIIHARCGTQTRDRIYKHHKSAPPQNTIYGCPFLCELENV